MDHMRRAIAQPDTPTVANAILLVLAVWTVFILPAFPPKAHSTLFHVSYTLLFITAVAVVEARRAILIVAIPTLITEWIAFVLDLELIFALSYATNFVFFAIVVFRLIAQVARTRRVTAVVILESINGYLLLGIIFAMAISLVEVLSPGAYSFPVNVAAGQRALGADIIYFALVTMTTLGYGDVVPQARIAKSLATLGAVGGQLYIAVIIAMLVGKWAGAAASDAEASEQR